MKRFFLAAALSMTACAVAPLEQEVRPPFDLYVPTPPIRVTARGTEYIAFETVIRNRSDLPVRLESARSGVIELWPSMIIHRRGAVSGEELTAALRETGRQRREPTLLAPHDVAVLFWFDWLSFESDDTGEGTTQVSLRGWPTSDGTVNLEHEWSYDWDREPIRLTAPVGEGDWHVLNGLANDSVHRRHVNVFDKQAYVAQRFAVDLVRVDAQGSPRRKGADDYAAGFLAWNEAVYAPCAGTVVAVRNDCPDNDQGPLQRAVEMTLANVTGNHVILRLDEKGPFLVLAHLRQGSVAVEPGQTVRRGDVLGRIGNSGNSTEPHLHMHVCDAPDALHSQGLPFEFESFDVLRVNSADSEKLTGTRENEIPLSGDVIRFR